MKKTYVLCGVVALLLSAAPARASMLSLDFCAQIATDSVSGTWTWDTDAFVARDGESHVTLTRLTFNGEDFITSPADYNNGQFRIGDSSLFFWTGVPRIEFDDGRGGIGSFYQLIGWIYLPPGSLGSTLVTPQDLSFLPAVTDAHVSLEVFNQNHSSPDHGGSGSMTLSPATPVPEPGSLTLLAVGAGVMVTRRRRPAH